MKCKQCGCKIPKGRIIYYNCNKYCSDNCLNIAKDIHKLKNGEIIRKMNGLSWMDKLTVKYGRRIR